MTPTRTAQGYPCAVASLCGVVVAVVSGATGIVAHLLAAQGPMTLTAEALFAILFACGAVGALTASGVGRFHAGLVVPAGLVTAQGSVHTVLAWSHDAHHGTQHGGGHGIDHAATLSGHATHALRSPGEHSALVREAVTAAAGAAGHGWPDWPDWPDWPMIAAHAAATVVTAGSLALVAGLLGWLAAHVDDLVVATITAPDRTRSTPPEVTSIPTRAPFLLARGLLRGPPGAWAH